MIDPKIQAELRDRFNPDGSILRQHQLRMLEMLKYIDGICKNNDIQYWLSSGTCLGAVRHGGFIPWDDDVDIEMLKKDYDRLLEIIESNNDGQYIVQTHKNDAGYILPFGKFRDLTSEIVENPNIDRDYKYKGVFIDIFRMEPSKSKIIAFIGKYLYLACWTTYKIDNNTLRKICRSFIYFWSFDIIAPIMRFVNNILPKTSRLRHCFGCTFLAPRDINDIFPLRRISFEGYEFSVPYNADKYLRDIYGDYMSFPDTSKIAIHAQRVSFNKA